MLYRVNPVVETIIVELIVGLSLLLLNGLLVACEFSLIKLRLSQFDEETHKGIRSGWGVAKLLDKVDLTIRTVRFGIILCTIGYAVILCPLLYAWLSGLQFLGWAVPSVLAAIGSLLLAVSLHYVVGELVPRNLAVTYPQRSLLFSAFPVQMVGLIARPVSRPLRLLSQIVLKFFGAKVESELEALGFEEQLRALDQNANEPLVYPKILRNSLQLRNIKVQDILLPRNQVQYINLEDDNQSNIKLVEESGHTRFPLCEGDLDNCIGLIHIKDIFRSPVDVRKFNFRDLKRDIIRFDLQQPLDEVLQELLLEKTHMALVTDEFGGTDGVITLELIIEQLVGDIQDEFDIEEELIRKVTEREYRVSGLTPVRELEEAIEVEIERKDDVTTFGGLITSELGRIPEVRETLVLSDLKITITEVDDTRVIPTRVVPVEIEPGTMNA